MDRSIRRSRRCLVALGFGIAGATGIVPAQAQEMCGGATYPFPYTDVSAVGAAFCPGIMEAYVTGVSKGTTPTTFSPNNSVSRVQMTTFLQRSLDQGVARASRRAALNQWATPQSPNAMQTIIVGIGAEYCVADGDAIWVTDGNNQVVQVEASTGAILSTWTGAASARGVLAAAGKVFVTGYTAPGRLYVIDPTQPPGLVTTASASLTGYPLGIAFDGTNLWTANYGGPGSVSIISPAPPYTVTNVYTGFANPVGILYDGTNIWVTDNGITAALLRLDASGNILQTVQVGALPQLPAFDGANIWVPSLGNSSITVVQASTGNVVATISADGTNKLWAPMSASFDGERILVTNFGDSFTVFKAADLSFVANVGTGMATIPLGVCSDGINSWVTLSYNGRLLRY